jgi:hypothetical protein
MKSATLRIEAVAGGHHTVQLFERAPDAGGRALSAAVQRTKKLPAALLRETPGKKRVPTTDGRRLGDFLFAGEVGTAWNEFTAGGEQTVTYLDVNSAGLANVPWELARNPGILFLNEETTLVLYVRDPSTVRPPDWELRILVLIAADHRFRCQGRHGWECEEGHDGRRPQR